MMHDREKVIKELDDSLKNQHCGFVDGIGDVYAVSEETIRNVIAMLRDQEAENGEWITIWREDDQYTSTHARCSICNRISERPLGGYCKWCGAKMNQEWGVDG